MISPIFSDDYKFQQQFSGYRVSIYSKLAHVFEVMDSFLDFDELKQTYAEVPAEDKAGIDAVITYVSAIDKHSLRPYDEKHKRVVRAQIKTLRKDKCEKFGFNITIAFCDVHKLKNVDVYIVLFDNGTDKPDYVCVDVPALTDFMSKNLPTLDRCFSRSQSRHSNDRFYWIPVYKISYNPRVVNSDTPDNPKFGLPTKAILTCSDNMMEKIACANFNVDKLTISRGGK